ncbi:MAG: c-type cytochrome [gamma proteobacterium endosymbiont of Lamellibrachia anaximandri]|nr:c-type cytochrome [gamma proteobacterium endosymbiont of Lamellibrachia anaximandri]MBL3618602.1 c-type cytochrome [gamma proteobacterium endosymbiont of Lamellibrachia anaximandri]
MKTLVLSASAAVLSLGMIGSAAAADGAALFKAKTCFSCHGQDANTPIMPMYPKLAGQSADYALNQMKDIKSGARNNGQTAAMKGIMAMVSDDEMKAIAQWLSTL